MIFKVPRESKEMRIRVTQASDVLLGVNGKLTYKPDPSLFKRADVPGLIEVMRKGHDERSQTGVLAAMILGELGDPRAAPALRKALKGSENDASPNFHEQVKVALGKIQGSDI